MGEIMGSKPDQPGDPERDGEEQGDDRNPDHHPPDRELNTGHWHEDTQEIRSILTIV